MYRVIQPNIKSQPLDEERRAELSQCRRDGTIPSARPGFSRPIPVIVTNAADVQEVMASLGAGALAIGTSKVKSSRRKFLKLAGGSIALSSVVCGCTEKDLQTAVAVVYMSIKLLKEFYEILEDICAEILIENPEELALNNQGIYSGLGAESLELEEFEVTKDDALEEIITMMVDIPPVQEVILEVCGVQAKYASIFKFGCLLIDSVALSNPFEVQE